MKKFLAVAALASLLVTASLLASNPVDKLKQFTAVGVVTSTTITGPMSPDPSATRCSITTSGPIEGLGLSDGAQFTLTLSPWPQPGCRFARNGVSALTGLMVITQDNGTLVLDAAGGDFNGDGAVLSGTYSVPSYNIIDPTAVAPTPSTGKFQTASGSGSFVFTTGMSTNAPAGSSPTQGDVTLSGLLNLNR